MTSSDHTRPEPDPVLGCEDPATATQRAEHLLARSDVHAAGAFWASGMHPVLRAFLWAAAVADLTVSDVAHWTRHPDDDTAVRILHQHADTAPEGWLSDVRRIQRAGGTTRDTVYGTLARVLTETVARTRCPIGGRSVQPCGPQWPAGEPRYGRIVSANGAHESDPGCARHLAELLVMWDPGDEPAVETDLADPAEGQALATYVYGLAERVSETLYILHGTADDDAAHVRGLSASQWARHVPAEDPASA